MLTFGHESLDTKQIDNGETLSRGLKAQDPPVYLLPTDNMAHCFPTTVESL